MISAAAPAQKLDSICYTVALEAPSLKAQETRIAAQRLQNEADNSLAGPEADFDYKFNASGGENRWGVSVGQGFDWPGVYYSRRKSNKLRESALENLHRQNVADKALEIKLAAIRLGQARQNVRVLGEAKSNFEELVAKMKYAFDRSETTILNLRKSELQLMSVNSTLAEAENELSQAEAALEAVAPGALSRFDGVEGVEIAQPAGPGGKARQHQEQQRSGGDVPDGILGAHHKHHQPGKGQHHHCADGCGYIRIRLSDAALCEDGGHTGEQGRAKGIQHPHPEAFFLSFDFLCQFICVRSCLRFSSIRDT